MAELPKLPPVKCIDDLVNVEIARINEIAERSKAVVRYIGQVVQDNSAQLKKVLGWDSEHSIAANYVTVELLIRKMIADYSGKDTQLVYFNKNEKPKLAEVELGWAEAKPAKTTFFDKLFGKDCVWVVLTEKGRKIIDGYNSILGRRAHYAGARKYLSVFREL